MFYQTQDVERTVIATQDGDDVVRADAGFQFLPIVLQENTFPTIRDNLDATKFDNWGIKSGDFQTGASEARLEIYGGDGDDRLYGGALDDTIHGEAGRDEIWGGGGGDRIFGDAGNDTLFGGSPPTTNGDALTTPAKAMADNSYPVVAGPETDTTERFDFDLVRPLRFHSTRDIYRNRLPRPRKFRHRKGVCGRR